MLQDQFSNGTHSVEGSRPTVGIVVDDASHVPAVEAIIAVLYGVEGSIAELEQHQLVHVAQYADMLQLIVVAQQAVQLLITAARTTEGLSDDTLGILRHITWSDCLLPLLTSLVESIGSDLERVWTSEQLSSKLLKLPLPAVRSLLSSDQLQLYSEDTVLYTAARYVIAQPDEQQPEARKQLSALVRAPQLSYFQLGAQAVSDDETATSLMQLHKPLLQQVLALKHLGSFNGADVARLLPAAPVSWQLPARQILPAKLKEVKMVWQVPVSGLVSAYDDCRATKHDVSLFSESVTAPISGMAWKLRLCCTWDAAGKGVKIGVFSLPAWCPRGVIYRHFCKMGGPGAVQRPTFNCVIMFPKYWGWLDFFELGTLQGPLEQSAWMDKGLPTTGSIDLTLTVLNGS